MGIRRIEMELPPEWFGDGAVGDSERLLQLLLDAMVEANLMHLRANPNAVQLRHSGVRWSAPDGVHRISSVPAILERGTASCASLSCWRAAELRAVGVGASPLVVKQRSEGKLLYHVVVARAGGAVEDPSKFCGMGG